MDHVYRSTIVCRLCDIRHMMEVRGYPDARSETEIDEEAMRRARVAGFRRVELTHMPDAYSVYARNPWLCDACAKAIARTFSVDANAPLALHGVPVVVDSNHPVAHSPMTIVNKMIEARLAPKRDAVPRDCATCQNRCMDMDMEPYCSAANKPWGQNLARGIPAACGPERKLWVLDERTKR